MFLNDEPSMVRPTLVNINPVELKYYPFVIGIDKHMEVTMSSLQKYVFQKKQKTYVLKQLIW